MPCGSSLCQFFKKTSNLYFALHIALHKHTTTARATALKGLFCSCRRWRRKPFVRFIFIKVMCSRMVGKSQRPKCNTRLRAKEEITTSWFPRGVNVFGNFSRRKAIMRSVLLMLLVFVMVACEKQEPPTPASNASPLAAFTLSPENGQSPLAVTVDGGGSSDPDGSLNTFVWNWGDESADNSGKTVSHTYAKTGDYIVTLTVTDNEGASSSSTKSVSVVEPTPNPTPEPQPDEPTGTLDETFGSAGKAFHEIGKAGQALDTVIQKDGTIVVVGVGGEEVANGVDIVGFVTFFNPDGTLKKEVRFSDGFRPAEVALTTDDALVLAGLADDPSTSELEDVQALRRLTTDGTLDESFGIVFVPQLETSPSFTGFLELDSEGRILLIGTKFVEAVSVLQLLRFTPNGTLDASFGDAGVVTKQLGNGLVPVDLVVDSEGRIVVVGATETSQSSESNELSFVTARFKENGDPDEFGPLGQGFSVVDFTRDIEVALKVAIDTQGRIVMAGAVQEGQGQESLKFALARLDAGGFPDPTFGTENNGKVLLDIGTNLNSIASGLALDSKGRILVAGTTGAEDATVLLSLRLDEAGTYGSNGGRVVTFTDDLKPFSAAAFGAAESLVIVGTQLTPDPSEFEPDTRTVVLTRIR